MKASEALAEPLPAAAASSDRAEFTGTRWWKREADMDNGLEGFLE